MADTQFDIADYHKYKVEAGLDDRTGFDPSEFDQFKTGTTHANFLDTLQQAAEQLVPDKQNALPQPIQPSQNPNPVMGAMQQLGQAAVNPLRVPATASANSAKMGGMVAEGLGQKFPNVPPQFPALAGMATQLATDPSTYVMGAKPTGEVATAGLDAATQVGLNKVLAPVGQILSGTKQAAIKALFNDPLGTLTAMPQQKAGALMSDAYKALGVTEDEMRLIAKAADRGTGGSQTVYDQVLDKLKAHAADAANNDAPTVGELIAGRRAASKLSTVRQGMEKSQTVKDLDMFNDLIQQHDPAGSTQLLNALSEYAKSKNRQAFLNLFPMNQNMSANALRGVLGLGGAFTGHPIVIAAQAPITTGLGTLAASAGYNAVRAGLQSPLVRGMTAPYLQQASQAQGQ